MITVSIDDFIERFVTGYLFGDLERMSHVTVHPGEQYGGVGYPMVATTLSGMELLGGLLTPANITFNSDSGNNNFLNYWDNYFARQNPAYTGLGRLFRQLMRNGVSHTFVAKPGIFVEKGTNRQMSIDSVNRAIYLDCNVFYREFRDSFNKLVQPIIDGTITVPTSKSTMQTRLNQLSTIYSSDSVRLFSQLPVPLNPSTIDTHVRATVPVSPHFSNMGTRASGATGPLGPTGPMTTISTSSQSISSSPNNPVQNMNTTTVPLTTLSGNISPMDKATSDAPTNT